MSCLIGASWWHLRDQRASKILSLSTHWPCTAVTTIGISLATIWQKCCKKFPKTRLQGVAALYSGGMWLWMAFSHTQMWEDKKSELHSGPAAGWSWRDLFSEVCINKVKVTYWAAQVVAILQLCAACINDCDQTKSKFGEEFYFINGCSLNPNRVQSLTEQEEVNCSGLKPAHHPAVITDLFYSAGSLENCKRR